MYELMPAEYEDMRRAFDELRYGQMSPTPLVGVGQLTQHDPSRAPEGKAIFHAWDYVPYERPDGRSWDEAKREFADKIIAQMGNYIDNVPEVVLDYHCDSPVDMERTSPSFFRGDLHGIATTTYQSGSHRPTPELGQYRVPGIERLYLVGPFQHPGRRRVRRRPRDGDGHGRGPRHRVRPDRGGMRLAPSASSARHSPRKRGRIQRAADRSAVRGRWPLTVGVTEGAVRMKIYAADKSELMQVSRIERQGSDLVLKGKVFGTMPMSATLTPEQARAAFKLLTPRLILFLLTLPFRKGAKMMRHEGKTMVVTGAAGAIGFATCEILAREGAKVMLVDIAADRLEQTAPRKLQRRRPRRHRPSSPTAPTKRRSKAMPSAAMDAWGRIDGFFNNAGIEGDLAPTHEYDIADVRQGAARELARHVPRLALRAPAHGRGAARARWSTPPRSAPSAASPAPAPTTPPSTARSG